MKRLITLFMIMMTVTVFGQTKEYKTLYPNGNIKEFGYITDGKCDSTWTSYNESGKIVAKAYYNMGCKTGTWQINTPEKTIEITYANCIKSQYREVAPTGQILIFKQF